MQQQESFEIRLPQFEGPFDLLLFFIERDELDIQEVQIATITDDFLNYIHQMHLLNIELAGEFIFVAATLMRIKAKMMLPRYEEDEQGSEADLKADLIRKLIEYKQFKIVSEQLKELEVQRLMHERRGNIRYDLSVIESACSSGEELASFNLYKLMLVYEKVISRHQQSNAVTHTIVQYPYSIERQKQLISQLLELNSKMDFDAFRKSSDNRVHFVYNFLAVLEMLQQQLIAIQIGIGYNNFWLMEK